MLLFCYFFLSPFSKLFLDPMSPPSYCPFLCNTFSKTLWKAVCTSWLQVLFSDFLLNSLPLGFGPLPPLHFAQCQWLIPSPRPTEPISTIWRRCLPLKHFPFVAFRTWLPLTLFLSPWPLLLSILFWILSSPQLSNVRCTPGNKQSLGLPSACTHSTSDTGTSLLAWNVISKLMTTKMTSPVQTIPLDPPMPAVYGMYSCRCLLDSSNITRPNL